MSEFLSEDLKVTNDRMLKYCEVNSQSHMDDIQIQYKYTEHASIIWLTSMAHYVYSLAQIQHGRWTTYSSR